MHKGKVNVWQWLPQGYWNSSNVLFYRDDILAGLNVIIYIDDVLFIDDTWRA